MKEFAAPERLAWTARTLGVSAYHAWLIEPLAEGCLVHTEETQYGLAARIGALLFPRRLEHWHQYWLEGLAMRLAAGAQGPVREASSRARSAALPQIPSEDG